MKKVISILLVLACLFGMTAMFTGCKQEKTLVVALSPDFAPMEFTDMSKEKSEQLVGFDVLLANYFAYELGAKLILKPMDFDACQAAVATGSVDVAISGFSWTPDRAETFLITDYYVAGDNETDQTLITLTSNTKDLTKADSYAGLKVGAQGASLQELLVKEQLVSKGATLVPYTNLYDALSALKNGTIDVLAVAKGNGTSFISQNEETIKFTGFLFELDELYKNNVCLVKKGNTELCDKLNAALKKLKDADISNDWYAACEVYNGISTLDEAGYDADGNKLGSTEIVPAASEDAAKKKPYETYLAAIKAGKGLEK